MLDDDQVEVDLTDFLRMLTPEMKRKLNELAREIIASGGYGVLKQIIIAERVESLRIEKMVR